MTLCVFSYTNYRLLLSDSFQEKKRIRRSWSVRAWARSLGLAGPSMLTMIMKGARNPGEDLTTALCRQLELDEREETYFRDLVELSRYEGNDRQSVRIMERLAPQRPTGEFHQISREAFLAISRWHYYAIREMVRLPSFKEDPEWISSRLQFRISPAEVKDAIRSLIKVGLLVRRADGALAVAGGHVETTSDIADEGIKRFHEQALDNAKDSLRKHDPTLREFYGTTLAAPRDKVPQAKALIRKFHKDFCRLIEGGQSDAIYQLEIGFYPVAMEGNE